MTRTQRLALDGAIKALEEQLRLNADNPDQTPDQVVRRENITDLKRLIDTYDMTQGCLANCMQEALNKWMGWGDDH